jgi:hypothetical protein
MDAVVQVSFSAASTAMRLNRRDGRLFLIVKRLAIAATIVAFTSAANAASEFDPPSPAIKELRAAFIKRVPIFGPGKIDLTDRKILVGAVASAMMASPPMCKDNPEPPPVETIVFFENLWGYANDREMQGQIEQKVGENIKAIGQEPSVIEGVCSYGKVIGEAMRILQGAASAMLRK